MARAAAPAPVVTKDVADHLGDALMVLKNVDLRTIKNPVVKGQVREARVLLTQARKGLK